MIGGVLVFEMQPVQMLLPWPINCLPILRLSVLIITVIYNIDRVWK